MNPFKSSAVDDRKTSASARTRLDKKSRAAIGKSLSKASGKPSVEEIRSVFSYDPNTGLFLRFYASSGWQPAGSKKKTGYVNINYKWRNYPAGHIAWVLMTGQWPEKEIDHKDRHPSNNVWTNLRQADRRAQCGNTSLARNNTSGVKGVYFCRRSWRWVASIRIKGKTRRIGSYTSLEQAAEAYRIISARVFGEFANPARRTE